MRKNKYSNKAEAIKALERSTENIKRIVEQYGKGICSPDVAEQIGVSFAEHLHEACEAVLYILCSRQAVPEGTVPFPQVKHLYKEGAVIGAPAVVRTSAKAMVDLRKEYLEKGMSLDILVIFTAMADILIDWMGSALEKDDLFTKTVKQLTDMIRETTTVQSYYSASGNPVFQMGMLIYRNKDMDDLSDEDLDKLYSPKRVNSAKSLAPVYICRILEEKSSKDNPMTQQKIQDILNEEYDIDINRTTLGRQLKTLSEDMLGVNKYYEGGYFYDRELEAEMFKKIIDFEEDELE